MSKEASTSPESVTRRFPWRYNPRLRTEHLGGNRYTTIDDALAELVANAFGARASTVRITLSLDDRLGELAGHQFIEVADDGTGMTLADVELRFMEIAVTPPSDARFAKFGVGRFAVHRIGTLSKWTSVAHTADGKRSRITFSLDESRADDLEVVCTSVDDEPTGTTVRVFNIRDTTTSHIAAAALRRALVAEFYVFLLSNPHLSLVIDGEAVNPHELVDYSELEELTFSSPPIPVKLRHTMLRHRLSTRREGKHQLWLTAQERTTVQLPASFAPTDEYVCIVTSPYLDKVISENRRDLIEMDTKVSELLRTVELRVAEFSARWAKKHSTSFLERLREEPFYPYRTPPKTPIDEWKQRMFDFAVQKLHEQVNLAGLTRRVLELFVRLLRQAIESEELLDVLEHVVGLTPPQLAEFREVLKETTLVSIIHLSTEVTRRLQFLELLHKLTYDKKLKSRVKERTQLHKLLEPNSWLFGAQFHLATSDRPFREVIRAHRKLVGLLEPTEEELRTIDGINKIPDLFLTASRSYPANPKNRHLVVEIKRPTVTLSKKEFEQIDRYAQIIINSDQFDRLSTTIDLYLVSGDIDPKFAYKREQKSQPFGCILDHGDLRVWAFRWSELIERAKEELELVREHVRLRAAELDLDAYLLKNHPELRKLLPPRKDEDTP